MKLSVKDSQGKDQGEYALSIALIENGRGTQAVHDEVTAYRAGQRSGTACTKTMGEVAGTGKKPWRQKGTGRARAGSFASPLWGGGGIVFGPKPRDFSKKVNRSAKRLALLKALGERIKSGDVQLVSEIKLADHKTKSFVGALKNLVSSKTTLVLVDRVDDNLGRASRNVAGVEVSTGALVNTYQLLRSDKLVVTKAAMAQLEERLK